MRIVIMLFAAAVVLTPCVQASAVIVRSSENGRTWQTANSVDSPALLEEAMVEVRDGDTVTTNAFSEIESFAEGAVFRKRGEGYLLSSTGLGTLRNGELRIEEGGFVITTNRQLGADNTLVVISNGASMVMACTSWGGLKIQNTFRISGEGYEGKGAIRCRNTKAQQDYCFYKPWYLDGDATYVTDTTHRTDCGGGGFKLDLGGHVLTVKKGDAEGLLCFSSIGSVVNVGESGGIVADGTTIQVQGCLPAEETESPFVQFKNKARLQTYSCAIEKPLTLKLDGDVSVRHVCRNSKNYTLGIDSKDDSIVYGTVELSSATVSQSYNESGYGMTYFGPITGSGSYSALGAYLHLHGENDFTGALNVLQSGGRPTGVAFWKPESVSANAVMTVTDADMEFVEDFATYELPVVTNTVTAGRVQTVKGGTNVIAVAFVKSGAGRLDVHSPLRTTGPFELKEGAVKFARYGGAGVFGGRVLVTNNSEKIVIGDVEFSSLSSFTHNDWKQAMHPAVLRNAVELGLHALTRERHRFFAATSAVSYAGVGIKYEGYFWNRNATNETWTVAGGAGTHLTFFRDGWRNYDYTNYREGKKRDITVRPGANYFQFALYSSVYNPFTREGDYPPTSGRSYENFDNWETPEGLGGGVRIDRLGRGSTNIEDYELIQDPGDGSFLTYDVSGENTVKADHRFASFIAAAGTSIDLFGNPLSVGTLAGVTSVTNANAYHAGDFTVESAWTLDAATIVSGGKLTVKDKLVFDEGVTLTIANNSALLHNAGEYVIAEAGEIVGMPVLQVSNGYDRRTNIRLSDDGKRIVLRYQDPGLKIICR